jgi:hypothetical protein
MDRKELIERLWAEELDWFINNEHDFNSMVRFVASGGFNNWTDAELLKKFKLLTEADDE